MNGGCSTWMVIRLVNSGFMLTKTRGSLLTNITSSTLSTHLCFILQTPAEAL